LCIENVFYLPELHAATEQFKILIKKLQNVYDEIESTDLVLSAAFCGFYTR